MIFKKTYHKEVEGNIVFVYERWRSLVEGALEDLGTLEDCKSKTPFYIDRKGKVLLFRWHLLRYNLFLCTDRLFCKIKWLEVDFHVLIYSKWGKFRIYRGVTVSLASCLKISLSWRLFDNLLFDNISLWYFS